MTTPPPATALVAGDGVVGLATAIALRARGVDTTIVAPDQPWRGASWGNAGHIAVEQVDPLASRATIRSLPGRLFLRGGAVALPPRDVATWLPFALRLLRASAPASFDRGKAALGDLLADALPAWRRLLATSAASDLLREDGHFIVWETPGSAASGRDRWMAADTGTARIRDATREEIAAVAALLTVPVAGAVRCIGSAQVTDHAALGRALVAHFRGLGGHVEPGRVHALRQHDGRAVATLDGGRTMAADVAIVAAGAASATLVDAPLIAERGYHLEAAAPQWPADMPPIVFEDRSVIATRFAGTLRIASFVEFAARHRAPDPRKWARLRHHADALGIAFADTPRPWMGARPTLPDYLPAIGRLRSSPAIGYAFGHQHLGLTLAAVTGERLAALLLGGRDVDLDAFDLARFDRSHRTR